MSARVILTAAPTDATMAHARAILRLAAGLSEGHAATERGTLDPDAVNRRADALVAGWSYDVRHVRPMPEPTARMIAHAMELAGIACRVEVVS